MPSLAGVNYLNTTHFNLIPVTLCSDLYYMFHCVCFLLGEKKNRERGVQEGRRGKETLVGCFAKCSIYATQSLATV